MEVVIKDGNRTVNWNMPRFSPISHVLDCWERGYKKCNRDNVSINGRHVDLTQPGCKLNYFSGPDSKIRIVVESIAPKKKEQTEVSQSG